MSVLYRALARASKARESARDPGQAAAPVVVGGRARGRSSLRPLLVLIVLVVVIGGGYVLYGDDIAAAVNVILYGEPPAPAPKPVASMKRPQPATAASVGSTPAAPAPKEAAATATSSALPGAAAANGGASATVVATQTSPTATEIPSAVQAAAPAPATASTPAAQAPATNEIKPAVAAQTGAPVPAAKNAAATPEPKPETVAAITPEQDLPSVLDRIRERHSKASLEPGTIVDRTPAPTAKGNDGLGPVDGMVSVSASPAEARDDTERAYDMLLHGQYEGAMALYDSVLKTTPDSIAALLGRATALHKLGRTNEARTAYQRVLAIDANNREALTNMMAIVAAQAPSVALQELRDMQKNLPAFSPIPAQIAEIEAKSGNYSGAITAFNRAIQLSPENGLYRLDLAIIQDRAGMPDEAAKSYQAALDRLDTGVQLPIPIEEIRARLKYLRSR